MSAGVACCNRKGAGFSRYMHAPGQGEGKTAGANRPSRCWRPAIRENSTTRRAVLAAIEELSGAKFDKGEATRQAL